MNDDDNIEIELEDTIPEEKVQIPPEFLGKYIVYFCYEWNDMDSCIKLYVEVDKRQEFTNTDLVMYVIDQFNGIAELEEGTLYNLMMHKQAYVMEQESDYKFDENDEASPDLDKIVEIEPGTNVHKVDFKNK